MVGTIKIIGLGAGDINQLTMGSFEALKSAPSLYLRTQEHPVVQNLSELGIKFKTFDHIYTETDTFDAVYETIVDELLQESIQHGNIVYAVPGHPLVAERTVQLLLDLEEENRVHIDIMGGQSFLDPLFASLKIDPIEGFELVDATAFNPESLSFKNHLIICQVYDHFVTSEIKLGLLEQLPTDYKIAIVEAVGTKEEVIKYVPLCELDYDIDVNNLRSVYVPPVKSETLLAHHFNYLRDVIRILRSPDGCPWDKKQTHESLKKYLLEEAYEVIGAIDEGDENHLVEELGDVLLQVMLHAQIGEDEGFFTIYDVIQVLAEKMIRRHPHVFGETCVENEEDVMRNWEEIKKLEKGGNQSEAKDSSVLSDIDDFLPPLLRSKQLQNKAAKVGFDWDDIGPVLVKVKEEIMECEEAIKQNSKKLIEGELGDLLFSVVNLARKLEIDPVVALETTNNKFRHRFAFIEQSLKENGKTFSEVSLDEMDDYWERAKEKS